MIIDLYKSADRFIRDAYRSAEGVSEYIRQMEQNDYKRNIDFRKNCAVISTLDELDTFGFFKENGNVKISIEADKLMLTNFTSDFEKKSKIEDEKIFQQLIYFCF